MRNVRYQRYPVEGSVLLARVTSKDTPRAVRVPIAQALEHFPDIIRAGERMVVYHTSASPLMLI